MLAGVEGALDDLTVERRRHADVDGLDLGIGEDRVEVDGRLGADRRGHARGPLRAPAADRLDPHAVAERGVVPGVGRPHEAGADDRER